MTVVYTDMIQRSPCCNEAIADRRTNEFDDRAIGIIK